MLQVISRVYGICVPSQSSYDFSFEISDIILPFWQHRSSGTQGLRFCEQTYRKFIRYRRAIKLLTQIMRDSFSGTCLSSIFVPVDSMFGPVRTENQWGLDNSATPNCHKASNDRPHSTRCGAPPPERLSSPSQILLNTTCRVVSVKT